MYFAFVQDGVGLAGKTLVLVLGLVARAVLLRRSLGYTVNEVIGGFSRWSDCSGCRGADGWSRGRGGGGAATSGVSGACAFPKALASSCKSPRVLVPGMRFSKNLTRAVACGVGSGPGAALAADFA